MTLTVKEECGRRIEGAAVVLDEADWNGIREVLVAAAKLGGFRPHLEATNVRALIVEARAGIASATPPHACVRTFAHSRCAYDAICTRTCPVCKGSLLGVAP